MIFKATVTKRPEVKLGDYKGLEAEKQDATVTDEQIEEQLNNIREQQAKWLLLKKALQFKKTTSQ